MALTELTDLGKDAVSVLPSIEALLKDPNENVRKYAEYAISQINK
jgi:vesicle coat complex subunit